MKSQKGKHASTGARGGMRGFEDAGVGNAALPQTMPPADIQLMLPMRDGVCLETFIWLPDDVDPAPAILLRTPYRDDIAGWKKLGVIRYVEDGYALVFQMIRGTGRSEGRFTFNAPHEKTDGYDVIEWIADQPWCDGNVGMDGSSYNAANQLAAASQRPPHLRCIAPHSPFVDLFREIPYFGGGFCRHHSLNWLNIISVDNIADLSGGFISAMPMLAKPEWLRRLTMRPAMAAADDLLIGDRLDYYRDILAHPTFDVWWQERSLGPEDYEAMDLPILLVSGVFDMGIGPSTLWRGIHQHAPPRCDRLFLIGPWDHGQVYLGTDGKYGPFDLGEDALGDPYPIRLAFFDQHLKGIGNGPALGGAVKIFVTGANRYRSFPAFPPPDEIARQLFLGPPAPGKAASLLDSLPDVHSCGKMHADPLRPFVLTMAEAHGRLLDLTERLRDTQTLVFATSPLEYPLQVIGEPEVILHVATDTPDADIAVYLAELRPNGEAVQLSRHFLRLRYRTGFDREIMMTAGEPTEIRIRMTFMAHAFSARNCIALLIAPDMFPWIDPNPNTGEPIAAAVDMQAATVTLLTGGIHSSRLVLPCQKADDPMLL
jgi:uncharacterized protein